MTIKYGSRSVNVEDITLSEVWEFDLRADPQTIVSRVQRMAGERVLAAIEGMSGARAEAAYFGRGDAAFEGDGGRGIGEELP